MITENDNFMKRDILWANIILLYTFGKVRDLAYSDRRIQVEKIAQAFTMARMARFSFPYYFTIPNSGFRFPKFALRISKFGIVKYM